MSCENCGACCNVVYATEYNNPKIEAWAKIRDVKIQDGMIFFRETCPHFNAETKKCRIYLRRPELCKEFKEGCAACLAIRKLYKV